jgi:hypothetical protein
MRRIRQIVLESHQLPEQRHHSRLFDEPDRLLDRYPGQPSFAPFRPFLEPLLDTKEIDLDRCGAGLSQAQLLGVGVHPERVRTDNSSPDSRLLVSLLFCSPAGRYAGLDVPPGNDPSARVARRHQQHPNLAVLDAVGDHTGLVKYRARGCHRSRKRRNSVPSYGNRIRADQPESWVMAGLYR